MFYYAPFQLNVPYRKIQGISPLVEYLKEDVWRGVGVGSKGQEAEGCKERSLSVFEVP